MPSISLINHDYVYTVQDVLKLFYGQVKVEGTVLTAGQDDVLIYSELDTDLAIVSTSWQEQTIKRQVAQDEKIIKREIKRQVYGALAHITNMHFPWGSLTGIRPTYIARELLLNHDEQFAITSLIDDYFVSEEKALLAVETAIQEEAILDLFPEDDFAMYIGVPFCPSRCSYCSFSSPEGIDRPEDEMDRYLDALILELQTVWQDKSFRESLGGLVRALYIGGGTPSSFSSQQLMRLFKSLKELDIPFAENVELTFEAGRADTIDREKLLAIKHFGFDKISINPQSMREETLVRIGREHSSKAVRDAYRLAKGVGFQSINMDLIAGLAGETKDDFLYSLDEVLKLSPESVSVHNLAVKRSSRLHRLMGEAKLRGQELFDEELDINALYKPDQEVAFMLREAERRLKANDYAPYYLYRQKDGVGSLENCSYAKTGHGNLYNVAMMSDRRSVLAFGAGSISKRYMNDRLTRSPNVRNIRQYNERSIEMAKRKRALWIPQMDPESAVIM